MTIGAAYPTEPLPTGFPYPPVELACFRPRGHLHLDRRTNFPAICSGMLLHSCSLSSISDCDVDGHAGESITGDLMTKPW